MYLEVRHALEADRGSLQWWRQGHSRAAPQDAQVSHHHDAVITDAQQQTFRLQQGHGHDAAGMERVLRKRRLLLCMSLQDGAWCVFAGMLGPTFSPDA